MHWFAFLLFDFLNTRGLFGDMTYPIYPVQTCPMNESARRLSSDRLGCNDTYLYLCVPNTDLSSLVELCYMKVKRLSLYQKDHCLKLSIDGYMDGVKCDHFLSGCPDKPYYGTELYQYPMCLDIHTNLQCFAADLQCVKERLLNASMLWKSDVSPDNANSKNVCMNVIVLSFLIIWTTITTVLSCIPCLRTVKRHLESEPEMPPSQNLKQACKDGNADLYFNLIGVHNSILVYSEVDKDGWNILHYAALGGNEAIFQDLLEKRDMDVSHITFNMETVLHIAAKHGNTDICKLLKRNSAYNNLINQKDCNQMNPFHVAARYGHLDILKLMEDSGCNILEKVGMAQENIAIFSCIGRSLEVLKYIGSSPSLKNALKETNYEGWNVAHYAAKIGRCDMLEYLIDEMKVDGINESEKKKNCLHTACEKGHYEACRYLVKQVTGILHLKDDNGKHAAHFAAMSGSVEIMEFLKESGLPIQNKDEETLTVLHIACQHARLDLCRYIIKKYPQLLNVETKRSWNAALFTAERQGDEENRIKIFDLLKYNHINCYHVTGSGKTALYLACRNKSFTLLEHLLKRYPKFHTTQRAMDPIEAADGDSRIIALFGKYKNGNGKFNFKNYSCVIS
ncbi:putative ankyrin repeat protein RF_0381 [Ostrea edulis]|uniref:putative ankyrin repeat protein RF_0381 n=1 Tax=Ostrea edulis TaxID=37623 RepID=UPI0024AF4554|nr:putative ankyrin repeat protein RF_0381 [Ostrea edulis]XP_048742500.2 putative ankyrin repeat protein RF_0381 [Ostrea edulis]